MSNMLSKESASLTPELQHYFNEAFARDASQSEQGVPYFECWDPLDLMEGIRERKEARLGISLSTVQAMRLHIAERRASEQERGLV